MKRWRLRARITVDGIERDAVRGRSDDDALRRAFLDAGGHCFPLSRELGRDQLIRSGETIESIRIVEWHRTGGGLLMVF